MVGWAAVTGTISLESILMFAVIFLWTPPHFWALAINKNSDYRKARVPMMPVAFGESTTAYQMFIYALALIPASVWLVLENPELGSFSMSALTVLAVYFCGLFIA
jgi:protoheme IX farnesyltransferase